MHRRIISSQVVVLLAASGLAAPVYLSAQSNTSSINGTVTDGSGAIIPGVEISIANAASGTSQVSHSGSKGDFTFAQVQPGTYQVHVKAAGFSEQVEKVEVLVSTPVKLSFVLTPGTSQVVDVETTISDLNTSDATLGKAFDSAQVANLPYLANNVTYLLSLQPGVLALDSGSQTGGLNPDPRTGIVNGARQDQTNITLDGVDNNDQIFGYAFNGALRSTRDSVEEFRVTTTNANADAGRSSGAQVSLVTKSGTNTIHGSAYEFYRDPATTSNNWFNKQAQLNSDEANIPAKVLEHTYGATLGLPLIKNKLFFFGAYEGFKQASDLQVSQTVPSTFVQGGAAGGLITGTVTYQACSSSALCQNGSTVKTLTQADIASMDGRANDPNCAPVSSCTAPATDAASIAYFNTFPLANSNISGDGYNTGTYSFVSPAPVHQITNIARLDYNISGKQSVFVRGNLQSDNQATALQFPGLPAASNLYGNNRGVAAGHIWQINDHMTNNFRYGFVRLGNASRGTGSQPFTDFAGISNITATTTDTLYRVSTNNFADDFTDVKGRHTIQAGFNLYTISNSQYFNSPLLAYQDVNPNLLATAGIANQGGSLDPAAFNCPDCGTVSSAFQNFYNSAIIDNVGSIENAFSGTEFSVKGNQLTPLGVGVVPTHVFRNVEQEYYGQDQWKATSQLTLTVGVRYVYLGVPYETSGQQIAPDLDLDGFLGNRVNAAKAGNSYITPIAFRASGSPNGQPNFWTPQKLNFAPRFAFAWATKDSKTSVRGGYALAFDHFGAGIIDSYQSNPQSLLSLSQTNQNPTADINQSPRFTGYHNVEAVAGATSALTLPYTPGDVPFSFDYSINNKQKTPYAATVNFTVQQAFTSNLHMTLSYVGRFGRHLVQNLDVAAPTNLYDPTSGQTYFQAATTYAKMADAGVLPQNVPSTGFFQNVFPNYQSSTSNYTGAQGYYADFAANRGNETSPLFAADVPAQPGQPAAGPGGKAYQFFFPQTSSVYVQSTTGTSNYNALQLSFREATRYGLEFDVNYTWSKSLDEGSDPERNGSSGSPIINTFAQNQMYSVSDFDVRHNVTANYSLPLPIGQGKPLFNQSHLIDRLFGGFQLNGVVHYSTGFPFSAVAANTYGTNFAFSSFMVQTAPIPTGGHHYDTSQQAETALKGISAADAHANLRFAYPGETGQRNNFRSDGYLSIDDGLSKSFHIWHEQSFKISAEVFNVINTNRFNTINNDGTSFTFGNYIGNVPTSTGTTPGLLLQPRQMQFSGKYTF